MTEVGNWPGKKSEQVRELENKIKKLEKENKKLLHKVHDSPSPERSNKALYSSVGFQNGTVADELEDGVLDIKALLDEDNFREDEWLYVSPKFPPTPVHKKITPREWLSEGHSKNIDNVPSLDDVRKSLIKDIDEAENLSDVPSHSSSLKRRTTAGSKPIQRVENRLKQGNESSSNHKPTSLPNDGGDAVPVVKWKAKLPAEPLLSSSSETLEEDSVPARKWKVKQVPSTTGGFAENNHHGEEVTPEGSTYSSPQSKSRSPRTAQQQRVGDAEDVPVVKWKAKMPDQEAPSDVPVVKWKAKMPDQEAPSDVPVVKWKAKVPPETDVPVVKKRAKIPDEPRDSDVPIVKWKAKMPEDGNVPRRARMPEDVQNSDVPVVKWKAKMPQNGDVPVARRKAKMPEADVQSSDVPVVKWKAKVPENGDVQRRAKMPADVQNSDVPALKWKAKMPEDAQRSDARVVRKKAKMPEEVPVSDVPVVKWKAKMPEDDQPSNNSVIWKKARMPEDPQASEVPVVKWKAKMPQAEDETSDVPVVKWKASNPTGSVESLKPHGQKPSRLSPKLVRSPRKVAAMPDDVSTHYGDGIEASLSSSHMSSSSSPPLSPVTSASQLPQDEPVAKSLSRRSSFSESRSPSPPSISPQVRMAIASPILSRRTPSPSRGLTASLGRQSPNASPALQQRHLQYISGGQQSPGTSRAFAGGSSPVSGGRHLHGGQQSPGTSRAFAGAPSPVSGGHISRIRTPRSQQSKTSAPLKGLTPPGERKHKRVLPSGPHTSEFAAGRLHQQGSRSNQSTLTSRQESAQHMSPGQDIGEDDDSWLEGCF